MSAILGVFGPATHDEGELRRMLRPMAVRGADALGVWGEGGAALAVSRAAWELGRGFSESAMVVRDGELAVVADASLYYRRDLEAALAAAGVRPTGASPSHLILAAYRAWGVDCVARLEGDFAFVLWDGGRRAALAVRDFAGSRPLYYAQLAEALVVASTPSGVLAHPRCPRGLNLAVLAEAASGSLGATAETAYTAVREVLPGETLYAVAGASARLCRHWEPPLVQDQQEVVPKTEAAQQLRELLVRAVAERLDPSAPSAVWMSGGWDSTAVFAAGRRHLNGGRSDGLRPVSMSFPAGDPGREDELIAAVAEYWRTAVNWVDIADAPLLAGSEERAAQRDGPFAHLFEEFNRALARRTAGIGCHVAFSGRGGDDLFAVSNAYLSDLLRRGQWIRLLREWRGKPRRDRHRFYRWVIRPALPPSVERLTGLVRGRPIRSYLQRPVPPWIQPDFARKHALLDRQTLPGTHRTGEGAAAHEFVWSLLHPAPARIAGQVSGFALEHAVEKRAPLLDERIIRLAASRPWWERCSAGETKVLLRRSMAGLLPNQILAHRSARTGITSAYLEREVRERWRRTCNDLLGRRMILAEFGIIDQPRLLEAWEAYLLAGSANQAGTILHTLQTELWLAAVTGSIRNEDRAAMAGSLS
jgi:asparagine synthase (glutamine-hydrolysing)